MGKIIQLKKFFCWLLFCTISICDAGVRDGYTFLMESKQVFDKCFEQKDRFLIREQDIISKYFKTETCEDSICEITINFVVDRISTFSEILDNTAVIINENLIKFLCKVIVNNNSVTTDINLAEKAANILLREASYSVFQKYRKLIRASLKNSCINLNIYNTLIAMIAPDSLERKGFLEKRNIDNQYLARLGDTIAIGALKKEYVKSNTYFEKRNIIVKIMNSGQKELIDMVLSDFNNPIYDITLSRPGVPPCTSFSTQYPILLTLRRYNPKESLFNEDLNEIVNSIENSTDPEKTKKYLETVQVWLTKNYKINLNYKPPAYVIRKGCVQF